MKEVMSKMIVTIDDDRPLAEALNLMRRKNVRRLAVMKEGSLAGILTERRTLTRFGNKILLGLDNSRVHKA